MATESQLKKTARLINAPFSLFFLSIRGEWVREMNKLFNRRNGAKWIAFWWF